MVIKRNGERKIPICVSVEPDVVTWLNVKSKDGSRSEFANKILKAEMLKDTEYCIKHNIAQEGD